MNENLLLLNILIFSDYIYVKYNPIKPVQEGGIN